MAANRKTMGELVARIGTKDASDFGTVNCILADVKGSTTIAPMGVPLVWVSANSAYEPYIAQAIPTTGGVPDQSPVCVVIGDSAYVGSNKADVTLTSTAQKLSVLYRGDASIKESGIVWSGSSSAPNKAAFRVALEKQGISIQDSATSAATSII